MILIDYISSIKRVLSNKKNFTPPSLFVLEIAKIDNQSIIGCFGVPDINLIKYISSTKRGLSIKKNLHFYHFLLPRYLLTIISDWWLIICWSIDLIGLLTKYWKTILKYLPIKKIVDLYLFSVQRYRPVWHMIDDRLLADQSI